LRVIVTDLHTLGTVNFDVVRAAREPGALGICA